MDATMLLVCVLLAVACAPALAQKSSSGAPPQQNLHFFRAPDERTLWLQNEDGEWATSEKIQYELDRRKHPSFTGAKKPFGPHGWQGKCDEDTTCLKMCETHGDLKCSVVARGCRSCLLTRYDSDAGAFHWNYRTYASTLNDYWVEPCFTCGEWQGIMADPERVIMDAPAVYGVATVAISSKQWTPDATNAATPAGREFVSAFRTGVAAWIQSVAHDPDRAFPFDGFSVPADTVMVSYVHPKDPCNLPGCVMELQRDRQAQFVTIQWWIVVGGGARDSDVEHNIPTVIEVGCDNTTFPEYDVYGSPDIRPITVDFDTDDRGNWGFKLLNCMVDPAAGSAGKSVQRDVLRLGSVIGKIYDEPAAEPNWVLDGFVLLLIVILCACAKKKHNDHMTKWKDIQDGYSIHRDDPQACLFLQDDLDKFQKVIQGEKGQAKKYDDEASPQGANERLFARLEALSELLQCLISEGDGQTPRDGIRAACYDRIEPELINGVVSLLDRYNLEKPRARSQKRLEQSIRRPGQGLQQSLMNQESTSDHLGISSTTQRRGVPDNADDEEESSEEESSEEESSEEQPSEASGEDETSAETHNHSDIEMAGAAASRTGNPLSTDQV